MQQLIVAIISAAAVILAAVVGGPGLARNPRARILKDIEIYKALPDTSPAKQKQLTLVERQVDSLSENFDGKRSPGQIVLGIIILAIAAVAIWPMVTLGAWWWLLSPVALFLLLFGGVGVGQGLTKGARNEKGSLIK